MSRHLGWRLFAVIVVLGAAAALALTRPARLGLDLRGGTQIVLEASDTARQKVDRDTVDRTLEVLRRRVDQLGVTEPTLQRSGDRRVSVELPGFYDPAEAVKVIGRTAQLAFHPVLSTLVGGQKAAAGELVLRSEEHTSELQSHHDLVCRLLLEKKKKKNIIYFLYSAFFLFFFFFF